MAGVKATRTCMGFTSMRKWVVRTSLMGEAMPNAYMGKILLVDLTTGSITEEVLPDEFYEKNLSGMGLAAQLLYDRMPTL